MVHEQLDKACSLAGEGMVAVQSARSALGDWWSLPAIKAVSWTKCEGLCGHSGSLAVLLFGAIEVAPPPTSEMNRAFASPRDRVYCLMAALPLPGSDPALCCLLWLLIAQLPWFATSLPLLKWGLPWLSDTVRR